MKWIALVRALFIEIVGAVAVIWLIFPTETDSQKETRARLPELHIEAPTQVSTSGASGDSQSQQRRIEQRHEFVANELEYSSRFFAAAFRHHLHMLLNPNAERELATHAHHGSTGSPLP